MALDDIYPAIQNHQMLEITYTNQKGETSSRTIEPYEVRDGRLWGWDIAKDAIRQFFLAMISECTLLETTFIPRF